MSTEALIMHTEQVIDQYVRAAYTRGFTHISDPAGENAARRVEDEAWRNLLEASAIIKQPNDMMFHALHLATLACIDAQRTALAAMKGAA